MSKNIIITGTSRGIGFELVHLFANQGYNVLALSRNAQPVNNLHFDHITSMAFDLNKKEDYKKVVDFIKTEWKHVDILINNAGVPVEMPTSLNQADMLQENDYQRQLDLNFNSIRGLCMLFLPTMKNQKHGRIMIVTSESHRLGFSMGLSHYAAAKSAALGYMRQLAAEVGHYGVTINALSLGSMNNFEGHERAAQTTIVGRAGTPEDVGAASLYLCSDEASWITGQTIPLNGGACTA